MWIEFNANPTGKNVGDCTVRAISKALGQTWKETYLGLALKGLMLGDMPSANVVWGAYLRDNGFTRDMTPDTSLGDYTVIDFTKDYPKGTFILALSGHVVCVIDGDYYDSWDSGNECPLYYWHKE